MCVHLVSAWTLLRRNSVALDFLISFDVDAVEAVIKQHQRLGETLNLARRVLARQADRSAAADRLVGIYHLRKAKLINLIRSWRSLDNWLEILIRFDNSGYIFVAYGMFMLTFTGGHIAHSHIVSSALCRVTSSQANLLYFFCLVDDEVKSEAARTPLNFFQDRRVSRKNDWRYAGPAAIMIIITFIPVALFLAAVNRQLYTAPKDDKSDSCSSDRARPLSCEVDDEKQEEEAPTLDDE